MIPLSNLRPEYLDYPYNVPNTLVTFHLFYYLYSMHRIRLHRNVFPNIVSQIPKILVVALWVFYALIALLNYIYLVMAYIRYAFTHNPYSPIILVFSHSHYYRFETVNRDIVSENLLLKNDNAIWSQILYKHLTNLQFENSFENLLYCKIRTFIETEVKAIKLLRFNLLLKH